MENKGYGVAKGLTANGFAAFVIPCRSKQTPADVAAADKTMQEMFSGVVRAAASHP